MTAFPECRSTRAIFWWPNQTATIVDRKPLQQVAEFDPTYLRMESECPAS